MTTTHTLYFGKHKGQPITEVPTSYLVWMLDAGVKLSSGLSAAVRAEITRRGSLPPPPPPPPPARRCDRHPHCDMVAYWIHQTDGRRAIRAECSICSSWLGSLPQTPENVALADRGTDPAALIAFLTALEDNGIEFRRENGVLRFTPPLTRELWRLERQCRGLLLSLLPESKPT